MARAELSLPAIALCAVAGCAIDWTVPEPAPSGSGAATGAGGIGTGGEGAASSSSDSSSSSGGAAASCDGTADCSGCVVCTQQGICLDSVSACNQDPECAVIYDCAINCGPPARAVPCIQQCASEHPDGADEFAEIAGCVCRACASDCQGVVDELCP